MDGKTKQLVAASVAGLVAAAGVLLAGRSVRAEDAEDSSEKASCYGINKCKGMGDCGGQASSCAGKNDCAGKGWLELDKETCLKIQGGRLTPEPA